MESSDPLYPSALAAALQAVERTAEATWALYCRRDSSAVSCLGQGEKSGDITMGYKTINHWYSMDISYNH
jgi:hypothetical protein